MTDTRFIKCKHVIPKVELNEPLLRAIASLDNDVVNIFVKTIDAFVWNMTQNALKDIKNTEDFQAVKKTVHEYHSLQYLFVYRKEELKKFLHDIEVQKKLFEQRKAKDARESEEEDVE